MMVEHKARNANNAITSGALFSAKMRGKSKAAAMMFEIGMICNIITSGENHYAL
jgi:hypothetical protein